jgi:leucine dehydrogenase
MDPITDLIRREGAARTVIFSDPPSGLLAFLVLDDLTLGPGAGGIRTRAYPSSEAALLDAVQLARAMTLKCALAGLDAGGAKCVLLDHPGLDRTRAFARLGELVEELGGLFRTAGDLGTSVADLEVMARHTAYVHSDERGLTDAAARGLVRAVEACAVALGRQGRSLAGLRVAVQGAGSIGAASARALAGAGAEVWIADVERRRAEVLAAELGARVADAEDVLTLEVDVLAPCAVGGVITRELVPRLRARAICGAANNALAHREVARDLLERGILHVPDPIASAGAVIAGIGASVMGLADPEPLLDRLFDVACEVLSESRALHRPAVEVAEARARARIQAARDRRRA